MQLKIKNLNGFTMIETLVSIVVLSFGILGFALMQIQSLKAAKTASEQSKAIHFATDMMDRIRTNKRFSANYAATLGNAGTAPNPLCADPATTPALTSPPTSCTGTEMAAYEVWQWRTMLDNNDLGIANAQSAIAVTGTDPWTVEITVRWTTKGESQQYVLSSVIH